MNKSIQTILLATLSSVIGFFTPIIFKNLFTSSTKTEDSLDLQDFINAISSENKEILTALCNLGQNISLETFLNRIPTENSSDEYKWIISEFNKQKEDHPYSTDYELLVKLCFDKCTVTQQIKVADKANTKPINRDMRALLTDFKIAIILGFCLHKKIQDTTSRGEYDYIATYEHGMVILGYIVAFLQNKPLIITSTNQKFYVEEKLIRLTATPDIVSSLDNNKKIIVLNDSIFGGTDLCENMDILSDRVGKSNLEVYLLGATLNQQELFNIKACYTLPEIEKNIYPFLDYKNKPIRLSITGSCNLNCAYIKACHNEGQLHKGTLCTTRERFVGDISKLIDTLNQYFDAKIDKKITITGGEPLLVNNLCDIVRGLSDSKYNVAMTTNGRMLKEQVITKLVDAGLKKINISVHHYKFDEYNIFHKPSDIYKDEGFNNVSNALGFVENSLSSLAALVTQIKVNINLIFNKNELRNKSSLEDKVLFFTNLCIKNNFTASFICDVSYEDYERYQIKAEIIEIIKKHTELELLQINDSEHGRIFFKTSDNIEVWEFNNYEHYGYLPNDECKNCSMKKKCDHQYALRFSYCDKGNLRVSPCLNPKKSKSIVIS